VAAEVLGYADTTRTQVSALVKASFDANDEVRNNAVRALSVIALSNPKRAQLIDAGPFIPLLNSATWSDRNKSAALLEVLSKSRQPELMAKLRADALDSLIEMAKWNNPGHAYFSRAILGRIAGIEEVRLKTILDGDWSQILKLL
jgi:Mrp family chromosome partitioning ATPase